MKWILLSVALLIIVLISSIVYIVIRIKQVSSTIEQTAPTSPPTSAPTSPPTSAPTSPPTSAPTSPPTSAPTSPPVKKSDSASSWGWIFLAIGLLFFILLLFWFFNKTTKTTEKMDPHEIAPTMVSSNPLSQTLQTSLNGSDKFVVDCPNCNDPILIGKVNCGIFRHGGIQEGNTIKQLPPHATFSEIKSYETRGMLVGGCGFPLKLKSVNGKFEAVTCGFYE